MALLKNLVFNTPVLRVNDREKNIEFYQKALGLKLVSEENAIAIFTSYGDGKERFIIEESPAFRTRAVNGKKKVNTITIKTRDTKGIEQLITRQLARTVYQGHKGYAIEVLSPEGDRFILHAEEDLKTLHEVDAPQFTQDPDFKGLNDFSFEQITLNVLDQQACLTFYQKLFADQFPIALDFVPAQGPDLAIEPTMTWDLEILELNVSQATDLVAVKADFEAKGITVYLDKKERVLVVSDPNLIEIWLVK
ncbi:MAG: peptidase [Streptococcus pyogenes]|uniref:CppA N-terminal domain-containing protein n=1 Tax=Streptococcus halichoeri TaxID=254785 RepID=UPI000DB110FB|nr:CppA N-terminal domain-containing protein [Streptococcus halichoeri]PZO96683.1 MAG: peptidase [Streptococcus pyogenes]